MGFGRTAGLVLRLAGRGRRESTLRVMGAEGWTWLGCPLFGAETRVSVSYRDSLAGGGEGCVCVGVVGWGGGGVLRIFIRNVWMLPKRSSERLDSNTVPFPGVIKIGSNWIRPSKFLIR